MSDAPHYYAHIHVRYTHGGVENALAGHCGQFEDHVSADGRIQYLTQALEATKETSSYAYPGSTTEICGSVYEGYIVRDTWTGRCGHALVAEARLFLNQEPCDPRAIQREQELLDRLAAH